MTVCDECFDADLHLCRECLTHGAAKGFAVIPREIRLLTPFLIFILGFILIIIGSFILFFNQFKGVEGSVSGGAVFLLGPIPIIIGGGPYAPLLTALALIVTIMVLVVWVIMGLRARTG